MTNTNAGALPNRGIACVKAVNEVLNKGWDIVAQGGKNAVNNVKNFVKSPDGKACLVATAVTVLSTGLAVAGVIGQNSQEFVRAAVEHLSTFGMHAGEAMAGVGGAASLISGVFAGSSLSDYIKNKNSPEK